MEFLDALSRRAGGEHDSVGLDRPVDLAQLAADPASPLAQANRTRVKAITIGHAGNGSLFPAAVSGCPQVTPSAPGPVGAPIPSGGWPRPLARRNSAIAS